MNYILVVKSIKKRIQDTRVEKEFKINHMEGTGGRKANNEKIQKTNVLVDETRKLKKGS